MDSRDVRLRATLEHVWANRKVTAPIVLGAARPHVTRLLARLIEERLAARRYTAHVPPAMVAAALAAAQIAVLAAWIAEERPPSADAVASALERLTAGAAAAVAG